MRLRSPSTRIAIAIAIAIAVAVAWFFWHNGDERRIYREVTAIQRLVARSPAESDLAGLGAARRIAGHFTDPFSLRAEPVGLVTRDRRALIGAIHQYRSRSGALYMRVYDQRLHLDSGRGVARLDLVAEFVRGLGDLAGAERYPMTLHWRRFDGDWLVESLEIDGPE